ncbi:MAG: hypothetical protein ACI87O_001526 [Planctomycetota bacterium]|jgi:hypothetical protein
MTSDLVKHLVKCDKCSAQASRHDARFCEYCGAELPRVVESQQAFPERGGVGQNSEARFQTLLKHSELARLLSYTPEEAGHAGLGMLLVSGFFLTAWIVVGGIVSIGFFSAGAGLMTLFPIGILSFGLFIMGAGAIRYQKFRNAPIIPQLVLVVDERVKLSGGGKNSSASTHYFTTLETQNGQRDEFRTLERATAQASPGEMGVAYLRDKVFVHFERVSV